MVASIPGRRLLIPANVWRPGAAFQARPVGDTELRNVDIIVEISGVQFPLIIRADGLAETKLASSRRADMEVDLVRMKFAMLHLKHNYLLDGELARSLQLRVYDDNSIWSARREEIEEEEEVAG